jgi:hypothetical protein
MKADFNTTDLLLTDFKTVWSDSVNSEMTVQYTFAEFAHSAPYARWKQGKFHKKQWGNMQKKKSILIAEYQTAEHLFALISKFVKQELGTEW